jgi:hypothetical protein
MGEPSTISEVHPRVRRLLVKSEYKLPNCPDQQVAARAEKEILRSEFLEN